MTSQASLAQQIAQLAGILRDCAAQGLHFSTNVYERDSFAKVQDVGLALLALATDLPEGELETLRTEVFVRPGAFSVGDAAIIDDGGRILLIRRADNGLWAMPGGALEVGETPVQGVVREALEETGVSCEAVALVGIHDSRLCGTRSAYHLYQMTFLCRPLPDIAAITPPSHANEVLGMDWFAEDGLPQELDPGHVGRIPEAFRVWHGDDRAYFDTL